MKTYSYSRFTGIKNAIIRILKKIKLAVAIFLDLVDLILGNIPILNTFWDIVTFIVLMIILKNKTLAMFSNVELLLPGLPILGQIDALIPIATLLTIIDNTERAENFIDLRT